MLSLLGLLVRLFVATRRTLAGWVAYAAALAVLYAAPGPLDELYVATSVSLVPVTIWLVVANFVLDRSTASLLAAAAGGSLRFHLLQTFAGVTAAAPLALAAVVVGRAVAGPVAGRSIVGMGLSAHLVAVLVGAAIGSLASRPVVRDAAFSLVVAVGGFVLVTYVPVSSPLAAAVDNLTLDSRSDAAAATWLVLAGAWAAALTLLAGAVASYRRSYGSGAAP